MINSNQLKEDHQIAVKKGFLFGAKLVRGAYMEKERARAKEMNYPSPIQPDKDARQTEILMQRNRILYSETTNKLRLVVHPIIEESNKKQAELIEELGLTKRSPPLQFLPAIWNE